MSSESSSLKAGRKVLHSLCKAWPPVGWRDVHVAVAISGGCDSMALLRALLQIKAEHGGAGDVFALHVNHQLRNEASDQDAQWCQQQCNELGVSLNILLGRAGERADLDGDGLEAAARAERYELLTSAAEQSGARYLAIAHTQNDQVETVLFRLLRGSGLRGLAGIPQTRPLTSSVTLVRPLLDCSRADLVDYLSWLGQLYRNDSSNTERRFARNRLRHDLLPELRENYNQGVDGALLRLASQADDIQQYLESQAHELIAQCGVSRSSSAPGQQEISFSLLPLANGPSVVVSEVLREVWRSAGLPEQAMTYDKWLQLTQLAVTADINAVLNLPGGVRASVSGSQMIWQWSAGNASPASSSG